MKNTKKYLSIKHDKLFKESIKRKYLFKQFFVVEKLFHYLFFISRRNAHVRTAIYAFHLNVCVTLASVSLRAIYASDFAVIVPTNRLKCIELSSHMSNFRSQWYLTKCRIAWRNRTCKCTLVKWLRDDIQSNDTQCNN